MVEGVKGQIDGVSALHCTQPHPTGLLPRSTYLLVHQFRLHLARQPGDTLRPGRKVGVSGSPNCGEQKLALWGCSGP